MHSQPLGQCPRLPLLRDRPLDGDDRLHGSRLGSDRDLVDLVGRVPRALVDAPDRIGTGGL